jgi:preprotein translocase subunit SecG
MAVPQGSLEARVGQEQFAEETVGWSTVRDVMLYIVLVINVVSMFALIAGILLHSGRGGGLSDMFGGGSGAALGSTAAERNLNRITFVFALVWIFTVVALSFLFVRV